MPEPTEGFAGDDEPSSPAELYGKFIGFISNAQFPKCRIIIERFRITLLDNNNDNIHSFAVKLLDDETYPTTIAKVKENIVRITTKLSNLLTK